MFGFVSKIRLISGHKANTAACDVSNIRELSNSLDKVMEKDIRMLVQERDYEGIRHLLSREPSLANAGVTLGPPCSTTAHPLHRICDAVFAKLISDDEAVKVAKILLEHGARIDGDSSTENADTPLMAAASLHAENLGIFYIQNGARIDLSDKRDGATALHWAAYCGRDMLVDELIRAGVDVNQLDKTYKCTPLVWALQPLMKNEKNNIHHQRTCVRLLLEAGTDISTLDDKTKTFLDDLGTEELEPQDFEFEAKNKLPTINELVVYVPTEDFTISKTFYAALGFELTEGWGGTMDCRLGGAVFRLQNYYVKDWAENFMMKFDVDNVQVWYEHAKKVISEGDFGNAKCEEIEIIGDTKILHVVDPCGVLLIFIQ